MQRLKVDDSLPLEARLVSGIIENSQHRVEGANFDVRKHLLEYDDVLNKQREQIYSQRDRIFTKQDLTEDIAEMLQTEVETRVQAGLSDEEGPWRLIAWLEGVQPPFESRGRLVPSFGLSLVLKQLGEAEDLRSAIPALVTRALEAEHVHTQRAVEALVDRTSEGLDAQLDERKDALDAFFESQRDAAEPLRPQKAAEELAALIRIPLRLTPEQSRQFVEQPEVFKKGLVQLIEDQVIALNVSRVAGAIERRLGETLDLKPDTTDWESASEAVLTAAAELMQRQRERLTTQVEHDLDLLLQRDSGADESSRLKLLLSLSQGVRTIFDQRTHRQLRQVFSRFNYIYFAARLLEGRSADEVMDSVLDHLEQAEAALQTAWGQREHERISQNATRLADFGPAAQVLGPERMGSPPDSLNDADRETLLQAIGSYVLNEVKRQLLLSSITELWVDYLTKVEALRVSIGLEAYAQRDPLVQYKGRASALFQQLLTDVRAAVIGRVFAYQPRRIEITPTEMADAPAAAPSAAAAVGKKKRRRH
jgi:preprotein translocase subunit SecA